MSQPQAHARRQHGLTLVELAIALAITAVVLGQALPALGQLLRLQALRGAAAELEADLQLARSQAVLQNLPLRVTLGGTGTVAGQYSCYMLHTGPADACQCGDGGAARCDAPARLVRAVALDPQRLGALQSAVRSVLADPTLGTLTPTATLRLATADSAASVRLVANVLGRVRACADAAPVAGFKPCA